MLGQFRQAAACRHQYRRVSGDSDRPTFCKARGSLYRTAVDDAIACRWIDEENVLGNRHERYERQLLMDDDNAKRFGIVDVAKPPLFAVEEDRPS